MRLSASKLQPNVASTLDWMGSVVDQCVNYGSHLHTCVMMNPKGGFADGTVIGLLRHVLEMGDAIAVLIKNSCVDAAQPLARSMFEAHLGLAFILEDDTVNRAAGPFQRLGPNQVLPRSSARI